MISLDTETTGVDFYHRAQPFLVTICNEQYENTWWEWDVDPLTRKVQVVESDVEEIIAEIEQADVIVMQNGKFDVLALSTIFPKSFKWPWHKTEDTLIAGHLLASNHPHDLTSMAIEYLGINLEKYEANLREAVQKCRNLVRHKDSIIGNWRIAKKDLPEMPSAKEKTWKYDQWLPRAVAKRKVRGWQLEWLTITADYANSDSTSTLALFQEMLRLLKKRNLEKIYRERMKLVPIICGMEMRGLTGNSVRQDELYSKFKEDSDRLGRVCVNIAAGMEYELALPKSGNNKSLHTFCFNHLRLPAVARSQKTGEPSLDKDVLEHYENTLPNGSRGLSFIRNLRQKRKKDTALGYMESYRKFGIFMSDHWFNLHAHLNITGTDTLRFSSDSPNEQQISKQEESNLRYIFGPLPGREWWSLDAQNIELRIPAYEAQEKDMIALFERPNDPPYYGSNHLLNFHTVFPEIWEKELHAVGFEKVGPHCKSKYKATYYQRTKNGGFCKQYGGQEAKTDATFGRDGAFDLLESRFSGLAKLNQQCIKFAEKCGYVETLPDRTVDPDRGYPILCARGDFGRIKPTVPLNYKVQSTAMWWMARAMVVTEDYLKGTGGYLIMQIHDELVIDLPFKKNKGNLKLVKGLKQKLDQIGYDFVPQVPITVGMEWHPVCWSEAA